MLVLGVTGLFRRRWLGVLAWLAAASMLVLSPHVWRLADHWPGTPLVINAFACFIGAALVALLPTLERWLGWIALGSVIAVPIAFIAGPHDIATDALLVSGALWFGRRRLPVIAAFGRFGDFSYGIFLLAFPTQQLIGWLTGTREPYVMLAIAFPATVALAALSWHLVERPCLVLKRHLKMPRVDALRDALAARVLGWLSRRKAELTPAAKSHKPS